MAIRTARGVDGRARRKALKLHGLIAREVAGSILSGRYRPGEILEGEVASCQHLQVSRTTYREAMKIVMAKGMVKMVPRVGTRVTPSESWHWLDPEVSSWLLEYRPGPEQLRSLFELRRAVEPEAAFLSASRRSSEDVLRMDAALAPRSDMACGIPFAAHSVDEFRATLYTSTQNIYQQALGRVVARIRNEIYASRRDIGVDESDARNGHEDIFDAIAVGDGECAREAAIRHIDAAWCRVAGLQKQTFSKRSKAGVDHREQ